MQENKEYRSLKRTRCDLVCKISLGTQLTLEGRLRDISLKSAFIRIKSSVYLSSNDQIAFEIFPDEESTDSIKGKGWISRTEPGEGFAFCIEDLDTRSTKLLKKLLD